MVISEPATEITTRHWPGFHLRKHWPASRQACDTWVRPCACGLPPIHGYPCHTAAGVRKALLYWPIRRHQKSQVQRENVLNFDTATEGHSFSQWTLEGMHGQGFELRGIPSYPLVVWIEVLNVIFVVVVALIANLINNLPYKSAVYNLLEMAEALGSPQSQRLSLLSW